MTQKLDILVIAVHPDDAELGCAGTLIKHVAAGKKVGIVDLTTGDLGTRGTSEIRLAEAQAAAKVMGLSIRENLFMRDGFFKNDEEHQKKIISAIRKYQPEVLITNAPEDRHPDHGRACALAVEASFYSGLRMISTTNEQGQEQAAWRPKIVLHYIQDRYIEPDFVVDVTPYWEQKDAAIRAFDSQFYKADSQEPASYISSPEFLEFVRARAEEMGHKIGKKYGEGFIVNQKMEVKNLLDLVG